MQPSPTAGANRLAPAINPEEGDLFGVLRHQPMRCSRDVERRRAADVEVSPLDPARWC